ncbi:alkaline phosphatase D family protein [Ferribacterium limneticum]|uniref:alkaline phosphatase D family protein n=1 Tax=Ferribacterium limneticum TaxID=76259 RepID=UPI001CFB2E0B|nr:alkaline phosphatase D family protein [Ferribacterium limneticum]UCV17941.1 alkaline phosphatase D family protein [Ferribacterium limneticum]
MTTRTPTQRRRFLRNFAMGGVAASAGSLLPLRAMAHGFDADDLFSDEQRALAHFPHRHKISFEHGVASGDPLARKVILWTRVTSERGGIVPVKWEMALDAAFRRVVRAGIALTDGRKDHTVKVDVSGLKPDTVYHYRFAVGHTVSPAGRTRTLPVGSVAQVKLAVFTCSNFPAGYFHAYREAAKLEGIHAAVHLGDYIYEYGRDGYASTDAAALGREVLPAGELLTLDDYRQRYAQYHTDADLQAVHAAMPFINVWDDHEIANDTWKDGAENHDSATEGEFTVRRAAALQAFHEWLPIRTPDPRRPQQINRSFAFGNLLALHMLDTRVIARDQQMEYANYFGSDGSFDVQRFAADLADTDRQLLGAEQLLWLQDQLAASGATWQMLGQQVLMGRMNIPAPLVLGQISFSAYSALVYKAQTAPATLTPQEQFILAQPAIPYNLDAWDGYAMARETVLAMARGLNKNLVVLAGDTHNAWASDLQDYQGNAVGVEYAVASVSSPGLEEYFPSENPLAVAAGLEAIIGPLKYANTGDRGYMVVTATPGECRCDWRYVSTVKAEEYTMLAGKSLRTLPGAANRRLLPV